MLAPYHWSAQLFLFQFSLTRSLMEVNTVEKSIIRMSIIQTVDYTNTTISIVACANVQKYTIMPLNLFTAIQISLCWII